MKSTWFQLDDDDFDFSDAVNHCYYPFDFGFHGKKAIYYQYCFRVA